MVATYMTEILPGLWLGDGDTSSNPTFYQEKNITVVINCTAKDSFMNIPQLITRRVAAVGIEHLAKTEDTLLKSAPATTKFIHEQLGKGRSVLVHCTGGTQRAAVIVAAYLMRYGKIPLNKCIQQLQSKRTSVFNPDCKYYTVLQKLEEAL